MKIYRYVVAVTTAFASSVAMAQAPTARERQPIAAVVAQLQLESGRAQQVTAILENSRLRARTARDQIGPPTDDSTRATLRAAMEAIHAETEKQLAAVLSAPELAKLKDAMPGRPRPGPGARGGGGPM
jgi:hypothetical protein